MVIITTYHGVVDRFTYGVVVCSRFAIEEHCEKVVKGKILGK